MLKIEICKSREGVCPSCGGTGVVIPRRSEIRIEVGNFCSECEEGAARWKATLELVAFIDPVPL